MAHFIGGFISGVFVMTWLAYFLFKVYLAALYIEPWEDNEAGGDDGTP